MSDRNYLSNILAGISTTLNRINTQPPYSECARIISRPLDGGKSTSLYSITKSSEFLDSLNLKASHEHISWDQSKDNIGFRGANGELGIWPSEAKGELFSENLDGKNYEQTETTCYDGELMREAVLETAAPAGYRIFGINCQEYVDKVKQTYNRILAAF